MALAAATGVDVETASGQRLHFVWVPEVNSTQDGMRQLLMAGEGDGNGADVLALGAGKQTKGRGTSGRAWVGLQGNVFLTMALPTAPRGGGGAPLFPFPVTLLPLRIGTIIAKGTRTGLPDALTSSQQFCSVHVPPDLIPSRPLPPHSHTTEVSKLLPADKRGLVNLKWPNDVLLGDAKVSGLLIEMDGAGHYLVGIGVNLAHAPEVPNHGVDRGRTATSLAQHGAQVSAEAARELSLAIATAVADWFRKRGGDGAEAVKAEWEGMAVWGREYRLREDGSVVVPLGLEDDGRLRVRDLASGDTRYLVAEYLH